MSADFDYIPQLNKLTAVNSTFQPNVGKLPQLFENKIDLH